MTTPDPHPYPMFSDDELGRRHESVRQVMEQSGVEHLVVYGAEGSGTAVQWLSEWPATREAALVVSLGEQDALFVQHYNHVPNARAIARQAQVAWGGPSTIETVASLLLGRRRGAVGVIGPLRHGDHVRLEADLGPLRSLDGAYRDLRLTKSPEEVGRLRQAAALSDQAVAALAEEVRPGMDERRLAAIVESAYLAEGGTNQIHFFAATSMSDPDRCVPAQFPSTRPLAVGDVLFCEISSSFWGYAGQVLRTFTIGSEPEPLYTELHRTADDAYDAITAAMAPGVHVERLVEASGVIEERGFTTYDDLVHGYGGGYLPPVLGSRSRPNLETPDMVLEAGMAIVVQPNVITTDETAGVQTGQLLVVTDDGVESPHSSPRGIRMIG